MTDAPVTREHREAAVCAMLEGGARALRWVNTGEIFQPFNDDLLRIAQAIADAEARGASRAAPPADEVAGLLNDCALLRDAISEIDEYARDNGSTESGTPFKDALDRIEKHLKWER